MSTGVKPATKPNRAYLRQRSWIVVKYDVKPVIFLCRRCGTSDDMPQNQPLQYVLDVMAAFTKAHRRCKERNDGKTT